MSKKVVVLSTSLRSNSNSELLAKSFVEGAKESGNEVEKIKIFVSVLDVLHVKKLDIVLLKMMLWVLWIV